MDFDTITGPDQLKLINHKMSEQSTTMKLSITNSQELRRSPRLNPQPRRSPRIKELHESDTEDVAPADTTPNHDAKEERVVVRRRSAGSRSSTNTPSSNNDAMATPKSKSTSKKLVAPKGSITDMPHAPYSNM